MVATNLKHDSVLSHIRTRNPAYYSINFGDLQMDVNAIMDSLDTEKGIIEFFQHGNGRLYYLFFTKSRVFFDELKVGDLSSKVSAFNRAIRNKEVGAIRRFGFELQEELIKPILKNQSVSELVIIPHGNLWGLNFDLLLKKKVTSNNPKDFPYLLKDFSISYANSIQLLFQTKNRTKSPNECLAFSFADLKNETSESTIQLSRLRNTYVDLPGTRKEIQKISEIINGDYFFGKSAVEANFKINAKNYQILHLALHGEVNHNKPEYSRLFFTDVKDSIEDNFLYVHELMNLDLPADMAVLSACNTGMGKNQTGEGVMSLGSAFQYAGTKSLLLSQWEVSDATTPDIMQYFYENLKEGMTKSTALQQAKLRFLESATGNQAQPYYWASFFVLGDNNPIDFKNQWSWYWALLLLPIGLTGYFFYKKEKAA